MAGRGARLDAGHQYQAWVELVARDEAVLGGLRRLDAMVVGAAHAYPVREKYTIVHDGRPTDVGLRGWPMVRLIEQAGEVNQHRPGLLRAVALPEPLRALTRDLPRNPRHSP